MKKISLVLAFGLLVGSFPALAAFINFENETILSHGKRQDNIGSINVNTTTLELTGNVWKSILGPYEITSNTFLNFDFLSTVEGEIHGIGFSGMNNVDTYRSDGYRNFVLAGSQDFGRNDFDTYNAGDGWTTFSINVGDFYRGTYDYMFFINDNDSQGSPISNSSFKDVEICQQGTCTARNSLATQVPEPAIYGIFAMALLGLKRRSKK